MGWLWGILGLGVVGLVGAVTVMCRSLQRAHQRTEEMSVLLHDSTRRFRVLSELSADWYWELDEEFRFRFLSEGASRVMGDGLTHALGKHPWDLPYAEVSGGSWEAHKADLAARRPFRDLLIKAPDDTGNLHWLSVSGTPIFEPDGRFKGYCGITCDKTSAIRAAEALRESEVRFRELTAVSSDWYWEQDAELRFTMLSDNASRILELPAGVSAIGLRRWELPWLDLTADEWQEHKRTLAERRPFKDFVVRHRTSEGKLHVIALNGAPIFDADGSFRGYRGTAQDITLRISAERALSESEARFRTLTELSSDWYWEQDENLRFTYLSETSFRGSIGKARWEIPGVSTPGTTWEEHRATLERRESFRDLILQRTKADGTTESVSVSGAPIYDEAGRFRGYRGVGRDKTAQIRASEALRESESRFRALTAVSSDWYWEQDEELRLTLISDNAFRIMKVPQGTSLGLRRWEVPYYDLTPEEWEDHKRTLAEHRRFNNLVVRQRDGEGQVHILALNGAPIFDASGRFRGYRGTTQDITARVVAEQALRESEARFRTLTELSSDWYWEQDEQFRFTFVSDSAFRILGRGADYVIGKCRWELPTEEIEGGWEAHKAALAAHRPFRDLVIRRRDSQRKLHVFSMSGTPVFDATGRFTGYRGVTREITEKVLAEEALRESERRVRMATHGAHVGIWERDASTDIVHWSPNVGAMLGRPDKNSTTPTEYLSFIHPDDRERYLQARSAWLKTGTVYEIEHRVVWPDATVRWLHLRGALERADDGRTTRTLGVIQDITERKHAESILRESEEKFRLLAENMRDVFWIYDLSAGRFDYVGPSYESVWGQPREDLYADADAYHRLIVEEDLPTVKAARHRQQHGEVVEVEFRIRRPDGELRWLLVRSGPMTNGGGGVLICGITEDITERKVREQRRMEEAARQRDALVSEVHHRVKNSLQGVVGLLRRHATRSHGPSPSLEMAITQLQSVAIVHGLQGQGSAAGVILQKMLDEMTQMHGRLSGRPVDLKVEEHARDAIQLAEADATAVALVLNELIANAVKHSAWEREDAVVVVRVEGGPRHAQIHVRNPGRLPQGFDQSRRERIGTGLRLVQTLAPREGMCIAFGQDGEVVEVTIEMSAPVLVSSAGRESNLESKHAGNCTAH